MDITHWEVERCIGKGTFGVVNAVIKKTDPDKGKVYAMKALSKEDICAKGMETEVFNELGFVQEIDNFHVCCGLFAFQDEASLYLVLDIALGGDMRVHIIEMAKKRAHFDEAMVRFFIASLVLALEYCHSKLILHRDIKPDNILIRDTGTMMLTDFGISCKMESMDIPCTRSSGTPGYMAPEICRPSHEHGVPSEIYSVGVYMQDLIMLHKRQLIPARVVVPDTQCDWCTADMNDFVKKSMHPAQEHRLKTLDEVKKHPFLASCDWAAIDAGTFDPPYKKKRSDFNVQEHAGMQDVGDAFGLADEPKKLAPELQKKFEGYNWNDSLQ